MTTLQDRHDELRTPMAPAPAGRSPRYLVMAVVAVLALLVGGVAGWMLNDDGTTTPGIVLAGEGELSARQEQMLDVVRDAEVAWQRNDVDAILALYAPSATFEAFDTVYRVADGSFESYIESGSWGSLEVDEPMLVRGDDVLTFHRFGGRLYSEAFSFTPTGELLITSHVIHT